MQVLLLIPIIILSFILFLLYKIIDRVRKDRKKRHEVYKKMLIIYENTPFGECYGFCWALLIIDMKHDVNDFPELLNYCPFSFTWFHNFWFPINDEGILFRIDILKKVIEQTKN